MDTNLPVGRSEYDAPPKSGDVTVEASVLQGYGSSLGVETFVVLGAQRAMSERWSVRLVGGAQQDAQLGWRLRDSSLWGTYLLVNKPSLVLRLQPGVSLPTGTNPLGLGALPGASKSVDPRLAADFVWGGAWLLGGGVQARVPVYMGSDGKRQGPFGAADLRVARRVSDRAVPWIGVSGVGALNDAFGDGNYGSGRFGEIAATGGVVVNVGEHWGVNASLRAPVWTSSDKPYVMAAGLGVRRVLGDEAAHEH